MPISDQELADKQRALAEAREELAALETKRIEDERAQQNDVVAVKVDAETQVVLDRIAALKAAAKESSEQSAQESKSDETDAEREEAEKNRIDLLLGRKSLDSEGNVVPVNADAKAETDTDDTDDTVNTNSTDDDPADPNDVSVAPVDTTNPVAPSAPTGLFRR